MTTLIGIEGDGWAVLAADSQITDNNQRVISLDTPKICSVGQYLVGISGDFRVGQIMAYSWKPPRYQNQHPVGFMGSKVVPSIRATLKENGYDPEDTSKQTDDKQEFVLLVAFNGYIFAIDQSFSFNRMERGVYSAGSGGDYAMGFLYSVDRKMYKTPELAKTIAKKAIDIASILDINTCPPVQLELQERI